MSSEPAEHPAGATLSLGGDAWAHPDLEQQLVPRDDVVLYPGNPRRGDQDAITASVAELGLYRAIIVQRSTRRILAGNHTWRGLRDLGAERVPVTWVDVDDTRAAAIVARDNHTSALGEYDAEAQLALLEGLAGQDALQLSGHSEADLAQLRAQAEGRHTADTLGPSTQDSYQEQYGVIALCKDARDQEAVYDQLVALGLSVRVVTV